MSEKRLTTRGQELLNDYNPMDRTTRLGTRMSDGERRHAMKTVVAPVDGSLDGLVETLLVAE